MATAGKFIGLLFFSRTVAHVQHLVTRNEAEHLALGAFYEGIVDLADEYAETYQGKYGPIKDIDLDSHEKPTVPIDQWLRSNVDWIQASRSGYSAQPDTTLESIVDDIVKLHYRTLDKLGRT